MSRVDGRKIVGVAIAGTAAVLGFAQLYLPFIADRDKLRGMFEEEDMPPQARMEMDAMMKAERQAAMREAVAKEGGAAPRPTGAGGLPAAGSMW
eukprot:CAMPEP_0183291234 /NCGR_PEP_ID=MMETSP0160_2-20130417/720_1 /TAXON_ID=2839 ORGANISM="Odontella Sinensis, Strain Grunow 1884" /NCGR_SAMPLE_ID=MMETSP0160_2 /ASSEMBLY_ACC=CAM_ASM_000250 /LENGTH=93 /DNA_ID=CAMNT_0025452011 /DNA_START=181 /DNA_END=459 /DNA_ORIENTATION=-